jgi:hypothetical protein
MNGNLGSNATLRLRHARLSRYPHPCRDLARDWARWTSLERVAACALAALIASAVPAGILIKAIRAST